MPANRDPMVIAHTSYAPATTPKAALPAVRPPAPRTRTPAGPVGLGCGGGDRASRCSSERERMPSLESPEHALRGASSSHHTSGLNLPANRNGGNCGRGPL